MHGVWARARVRLGCQTAATIDHEQGGADGLQGQSANNGRKMRRKTVAKRLLDLQYESEEEDKEREYFGMSTIPSLGVSTGQKL